jgi:hypothetical protein
MAVLYELAVCPGGAAGPRPSQVEEVGIEVEFLYLVRKNYFRRFPFLTNRGVEDGQSPNDTEQPRPKGEELRGAGGIR